LRKKVQKGRCEKRKILKCNEILKTYDAVQYACADYLSAQDNIAEIRCNVILDDLEDAEYTSDFVCKKKDGDLLVRECVYRKQLDLPRTAKLLELSREYWAKRGVTDWRIVIDANSKE
jgi:hypothetical protein